jgi:hypothetical protein
MKCVAEIYIDDATKGICNTELKIVEADEPWHDRYLMFLNTMDMK